ncbi:hypothetical protein [Natronorubrum daqingense]|uniref:Uncharacterized protein n=1 Tax=Natronorubrum daqingense TaxID=588898 RepID=A0A1N6Y686_9EURY|nr:hypothetical protein [Natronorubrum daqingense]APX95766.1 hypothetical protein BB347_03565 [Natronorubrum daqingense]SIR10054.1 hypothetical protein SAMN05421809_0330 [Natronorubrum daqingense]
MVRQVVSQFRERVDIVDVGALIVFLGVFSAAGMDSTAISILLGIVVVAPVLRATMDALGLDLGPVLAKTILGVIVAVAGIHGSSSGDLWLSGALAALGGWLLLDAVDTWRHPDDGDDTANSDIDATTVSVDAPNANVDTTNADGEPADEDDMSNEEVYLVGEHNRWLVEALREADRPLTAAEIKSETGLTDEDFERLLEIHGESGPIERVGNGYTVDESEMGARAMVETVARGVGGRVLRPFRVFRASG